jgi:hypothetical protein
MRRLLATLALLPSPVLAEDPPVTEAAAPSAEIPDEREIVLRDLESRASHLRSGRDKMRAGLVKLEPELRKFACPAAVSANKVPEFFEYAHGRVRILEKPENFSRLDPDQIERLARVKVLIAELAAEPDLDCRVL